MSEPIIKLFNCTPHPIETMMWAFKNMHGVIQPDFEAFVEHNDLDNEGVSLKKEFVELLAADPLSGGVQEFVSTTWFFGNVSRALQQQLTRHRTAAYSIQSLRIVDKKDFVDKGDFLIPDDVKDEAYYIGSMYHIQDAYNELLNRGERVQVARGILPLNIFSPITMCVNLRNVRALINTRLCNHVQGEFRQVAEMMVDEILTKMGSEFESFFGAPCEQLGFCSMPNSCGKMPQLPGRVDKFTEKIKDFIKK